MWWMLWLGCETPPELLAETLPETAPAPIAAPADPFAQLLDPGAGVAAGFVSPVGKGWIRKDNGWSHSGAATVLAPADGQLSLTASGEAQLQSVFYENSERQESLLLLSGLAGAVEGPVKKGMSIGKTDHLSLSLQVNGAPVTWDSFLLAHASLFVPQREPVLAVVSQERYEMRVYQNGLEQHHYDVSFGQEKGAKVRRGDNRTPVGMYFVTAKSLGPFDGPYGNYYGGHWMKLNYPNAYDAVRGVEMGLITPEQQAQIAAAWRARKETLQKTQLGGGIGFHGWAQEWSNYGPRHLSWGCIVLHLGEVDAIYQQFPVGTMVMVIP